MLTRSEIEARVPQSGAMCLLDRVVRWDATSIICQAASPRADHPLALTGGVPVVAAVEYAAQAAALHGALLDGRREARRGRLAKLGDVELSEGWLGADTGGLTIHAQLLARSDAGCTYAFAVHDAQACRARGCLLVAFSHES